MLSLPAHLQASRRLAEGGADDGPRRSGTPNPLEKTRLLFEAGKIYQEKLGDEAQAADLYARVLQLDPEHVEAAEPLRELYFKREEWAPLVPVLEMLARKADRKTNRELTLLYYRLAKAADELGDNEKALKYYKQSYDLDSTYLPTLIGSRRPALQDGGLGRRVPHLPDDPGPAPRRPEDDGHRRHLLPPRQHQAEARRAQEGAQHVREGAGDPSRPPRRRCRRSSTSTATPATGRRSSSRSAGWSRRRRRRDEKFTLLDEIAGIYKEKLKNPQKAIAAYLEALEAQAGRPPAAAQRARPLHRDQAVEEGGRDPAASSPSSRAARCKARFLSRPATSPLRAALHRRGGRLLQPGARRGPRRSEGLRADRQDHDHEEGLEEPGAQLPQDDQAARHGAGARARSRRSVALWHALGEIYRSRLKDYKSAIAGVRGRVQLDPDATARHQILAELYQLSGPGAYEQGGQGVPPADQGDAPTSVRWPRTKTLRKLYMELRQYDKAWCVAAAASFLRKADAEETQFYEQYKPKVFTRARARLTEELWQARLSPRRGPLHLGDLRGGLPGGRGGQGAKEHKDWGLKRKDKRDVANDQLLFSKVFNYVNQVLGVPQPEVYLRPESPGEHGAGERAREGAADAVVRRALGPAAGPAREGAGLRHRQAPDVHAAAITSCAGRTSCRRSPS